MPEDRWPDKSMAMRSGSRWLSEVRTRSREVIFSADTQWVSGKLILANGLTQVKDKLILGCYQKQSTVEWAYASALFFQANSSEPSRKPKPEPTNVESVETLKR